MKKILLVEDSIDCYNIVNRVLGLETEVRWVQSINEAKETLETFMPDLFLLDILLPDGSGYELLSYLNESMNQINRPVLFLSAKKEMQDIVMGFTLGADDYICKPFNPLELKLRVFARLKGNGINNEIKLNGLKLDLVNHQAFVQNENKWKNITLTSTEFKLLALFASNFEKPLAREVILDKVWGEDVHLFPRIIDTYVCKLRKKIEGANLQISSLNRLGYRLASTRAS